MTVPVAEASGKRNHDSSIFTRPFSTGSVISGQQTSCRWVEDVRFTSKSGHQFGGSQHRCIMVLLTISNEEDDYANP
jgi:hypothetical protein